MKKRLIILSLIILCLNLSGCNKSLSVEKRGDESVINVKSEDKEMNQIIEKARQSVNDFLKELNNPSTSGTDFSVKYPFATDAGSESSKEHIWLVNIEKNNDKYYGVVANEPFYIKNMKIDDKVEFNIEEISDWKYIENGFLVGGKSIIYFYNQMPDGEKKDFEKAAGFKIKNH
ncbi:MAG: DUF2314 domain-containing protein [Clostridiaceae bacterium]|nr:DUF2314 domain-containing protein [Clostridiaceae bacterium]